jgi:hypothetical protein
MKGNNNMKNIILTIAMFILTIGAQAQTRIYVNYGPNIESYLDSNNIFYVGILDRKLLSDGKSAYRHNNIEDLAKFNSLYNNDDFKTKPDSNYIIMKEYELYEGKIWDSRNLEKIMSLVKDNSDIVGMKHFETPNSKVFDKIIIYEVVIRGNFRPEFVTMAIGLKKDGTYSKIFDI